MILTLDCTVSDMNSDLSYPVITQHCPDPVLGAEMNLLMDGNLQTGLTLSYPSFFFVASEDGPDAKVKLSCSVSINFCLPSVNIILRWSLAMQMMKDLTALSAVNQLPNPDQATRKRLFVCRLY